MKIQLLALGLSFGAANAFADTSVSLPQSLVFYTIVPAQTLTFGGPRGLSATIEASPEGSDVSCSFNTLQNGEYYQITPNNEFQIVGPGTQSYDKNNSKVQEFPVLQLWNGKYVPGVLVSLVCVSKITTKVFTDRSGPEIAGILSSSGNFEVHNPSAAWDASSGN